MEELKGICITIYKGNEIEDFIEKKFIDAAKDSFVSKKLKGATKYYFWFEEDVYNEVMEDTGNDYLDGVYWPDGLMSFLIVKMSPEKVKMRG